MTKVIVDLFIEKGYPYNLNVNMDTVDGTNIEPSHTCYFYCESIGTLTFSVVDNRYELEISSIDTDKLGSSLEDYSVYVIANSDGKYRKVLSGRIHTDKKVRA
jgi:hypothetical protein